MATRAKVGKGLRVRRVTSREERKRPSVYMRLKTDESFSAYALFEPDPGMENNPLYFEFYSHWDEQGNRYVSCAGEDCPFCMANNSPSTRAITGWYFPDNEKGETIKLFEVNYGTIQTLDDEAEDEDGLMGKKLRIKRLDDRGNYTVKVRSGPDNKPLTQSILKKVLAEAEEQFDLQDMQEKRLRAELERMRAIDALEDDEEEEEDEEETTPPKRTGKPKARVEEDEEEEEETDEDEEDEEDEIEAEADEDDEEEDESDEDEDEEEDEETEDEEEIQGVFTVSRIANEEDGILNLTNEDGDKFKMFIAQDMELDYDEIKKGVDVELTAQADDEGDWIITEIEVATPKRRAPARRSRK